MHRQIIPILTGFLFITTLLQAEISPVYSDRKDRRFFANPLPEASYFMRDNYAEHPGLPGKEKQFFPALEDCRLYFQLPMDESARLSINTGEDIREVYLPASEADQSLTLIISEGLRVQSVLMPVHQKYAIGTGTSESEEPEILVDLGRPDEYILTLPAAGPSREPGIIREVGITLENRAPVTIWNSRAEQFRLEAFDGIRQFNFPYPEERATALTLTSSSGPEFLSFQTLQVPAFPEPLVRSGEQILNSPPADWRNGDFEIYSWSSFPEILIFDCLDYEVQNRFFRRLAFYVEKDGYKGRLLSNSELAGKHAWNAHDYRPYDLADFFNLVNKRNFPIYPEEVLLRDILISRGILIQDEQGVLRPGEGAVLSISQESSRTLRYRFFVHEGAHGIYFISFEYREFVRKLWESLHEDDRAMWRFFLGWYGYDPAEEDLMINEFQAYLLQQRVQDGPAYFAPRMASLAGKYPAQRGVLERGTGAGSAGFQVWAELIDEWIYAKWGLRAGNFFPLHKDLQ